MYYLLSAGKTLNRESFFQALKELETVNEEKLMTIAESLVDELKPQIFQKGIEQGKHERDLAIAQNMLAEGLDPQLISSTTGLSHEEISQLI